MSAPTPLAVELRRMIATNGPISVARYMALCLGHPKYGYYATRDPLGASGDFTTAPEISQMFGELIGLWAAAVWQQMNAPRDVALVELGPGRGTLIADALRATKVAPGFHEGLTVHLIETNPILRRRQQQALAAVGVPVIWHNDIADLPHGPLIVLANEFFDALPVHQAVKTAHGWHERMVGLDAAGRLAFALDPDPIPDFAAMLPPTLHDAPPGALFEWRGDVMITELFRAIIGRGGAALVIDYGHTEGGCGDTLQALHGHAYADPLSAPGETDLTAHVDFAVLARTAAQAGTRVHGPLTQGDFLRRIGIEARATKLKAKATAAQAAAVDAALARLAGDEATAMGALFKAIAFADTILGPLPGFDS